MINSELKCVTVFITKAMFGFFPVILQLCFRNRCGGSCPSKKYFASQLKRHVLRIQIFFCSAFTGCFGRGKDPNNLCSCLSDMANVDTGDLSVSIHKYILVCQIKNIVTKGGGQKKGTFFMTFTIGRCTPTPFIL